MSAPTSGLSFAMMLSDSGDKPGSLQRVNALLRPVHILKHTDRKPSSIDVDHGGVIYQGPGVRG